jgi:zinc protease
VSRGRVAWLAGTLLLVTLGGNSSHCQSSFLTPSFRFPLPAGGTNLAIGSPHAVGGTCGRGANILTSLNRCGLQERSRSEENQLGETATPYLIVHPDPSAPLVAIEVWVRAGSACETPETAGAAHLLEHLIFKGTPRHPAGTLDAAVEAAGGILKASTEREWTRYQTAVLPDHWEPVLRLLLEHLLHPALPESELQRERTIMLQDEYALYQADPIRTARDALYAQAYGEHPYALPPFGSPKSLMALSRAQLLDFHSRYYRPDRMVIAVVGAVSPERVQQIVQEVGIPISREQAGSFATPLLQVPPTGGGNQETVPPACRGNLREGVFKNHSLFVLGVPAPSATQPEAMLAAEIVRLALTEPYRGLLYEGHPPFLHLQSEYLPRSQLGLTLFFFQVQADSEPAPANAPPETGENEPVHPRWEAALRQIVEGRARPQLELARQWLITRHQQAMRNPLERARLYGLYATLGMPNLPDEYGQRAQSLTLEQIEKVAQQFLTPHQSAPSTGREYPPLLQVPPASVGNQNIAQLSLASEGNQNIAQLSLASGGNQNIAQLSPASEGNQTAPAPTAQPTPFRQVLPNRMRVIALRQPGAKQVVMQLLVATGPDAERDFPAGTGELTARMLFTTTHNETQATLAYRIARSGGTLQLHYEPIGVRIIAIAEPGAVENVLALLREGLTRAEFESESLQRALQAAQAERQRMDGTHELPLYDALLRQLMEGGTLYARAEELQQVRLEHIRAFYTRYYRPERFVLVIAGDMPAEQLTELMQRYWGSEADFAPLLTSPVNGGGTQFPSPSTGGQTQRSAPTPSPLMLTTRQFFGQAEGETDFAPLLTSPVNGGETRAPSPSTGRAGVGAVVGAVAQPENAPALYFGFGLGTEVRSPEEYAALLTLHALLCEGKRSLLFQRFREEQGIGYAFGGMPIVWQGKGFLLGFLQVGRTRLAQRDELLRQMEAMVRTTELKPETLQRAVALVEGRWRRDYLDLFERTRRLALAEASGVGYLAEQNLPKLLKQMSETALLQLMQRCLPSTPVGVK